MLRSILLNICFPILRGVVALTGRSTDSIDRLFVKVNNRLVSRQGIHVAPKQILLLLPHCLQNWDCDYKLTGKLENCRRCGACEIKDLVEMSATLGIKAVMASGGTIALMAVREYKPDVIVAVACERDLAAGIRESLPLPAWGIFNSRPNGPCKNTLVDPHQVEQVVKSFIHPYLLF